MRLTNQLRDAFVTSVMNNVPRKEKMSLDVFHEKAAKRIEGVLPEHVKKVLKMHPELFQRIATTFDALRGRSHVYAVVLDKNAVKAIDFNDMISQHEAYRLEDRSLADMKTRLNCIAATCNTSQDLARAFPELIEFIPPEPPKKQLPVAQTGIVTELLQAGLTIKKKAKNK